MGLSTSASTAQRVAALEAVFREVAATRMAGVPVMHAGLRVQALGFETSANAAECLLGMLVTPWFMNLVRLPLQALALGEPGWLGVGQRAQRHLGAGAPLDFLGSFEPGLGVFEASSLFSPMFDFADHAAAVQTAAEALRLLRLAPPDTPAATAPPRDAAVPSRRGFLFGRANAEVGR